nr:hypothetical protein CFP56_76161 [Quercus suber]
MPTAEERMESVDEKFARYEQRLQQVEAELEVARNESQALKAANTVLENAPGSVQENRSDCMAREGMLVEERLDDLSERCALYEQCFQQMGLDFEALKKENKAIKTAHAMLRTRLGMIARTLPCSRMRCLKNSGNYLD